jgi:putative membrane-bound dehydrogenase-like protein
MTIRSASPERPLRPALPLLMGLLLGVTGPQASGAEPLSPQAALAAFQVHPDCRIELVAAEPDVMDPIHIAFDCAGRLWVVEYADYPHGPQEGQPGLSRIRVLTDDDGDGRYERPVVFADQLLFATGLLPWRGGVIVTTAGSVLFLRDSDGDGRADEAQEWFTGFKQENPQLRANHPTLGLDNHIYIASGLRGGEVGPGRDWREAFGRSPDEPTPGPVSLSGRDFRFDPLTGAFESSSGPGQFGLAFDDWGRRFVCDNRHPCKQLLLEDDHLRRNPHVSVPQVFEDVLPAGENSRLFPLSRTWTTSNLHANQFTAACGLCIYRGDALPPEMSGNVFVCDPTANLVHRAILEPRGSTFTSRVDRPGVEFLATADEWCRPVNLKIGPDGALYVVDMYRAVIEHPQFMPEELQNRPDLLWGMDHGRIWRVVSRGSSVPPPVAVLRPQPQHATAELAAFLAYPNAWQRETAQRLLLERGTPAAEDARALSDMLDHPSPHARAHTLWILAGWSQLPPARLLAALHDPSPRVREQAARIAGRGAIDDPALAGALADIAAASDDGAVRLAAVLALAVAETEADHAPLLAQLAIETPDDLWLQTALQLAARDSAGVTEHLVRLIATSREAPSHQVASPPDDPRLAALLRGWAELTGRQQRESGAVRVLEVSRQTFAPGAPMALALVRGLCTGLRAQRLPVVETLTPAGPWAQDYLDDLFAQAAATAGEGGEADQPDAVALLEFAPWEQARVLLEVFSAHPQATRRRQALEVLGRRREPEIGSALVADLASLTPEQRSAQIAAIFSQPERISLLLDELEAGRCSPRLIDPARAKQLTSHRDAAIKDRAMKLFAESTPEARQNVLAEYAACLTLEADPRRGQEIFKAQCSTCHRIGEIGVDVAPDISDTRTKSREYLLTAILDPNRAIDANFFAYTLIDRDGVVHTGVIATETATSVTLKQPEGKTVTIPRDQIEELRSTGQSLMPEGLERNITLQQMADLISFLKNWRYLDGSVPPEVIR